MSDAGVGMNGYKDLEIYRLAHALGVGVHPFSLTLPRHEMYESGSQMRRSAKSIAANIVEGYGRRVYKADFEKFLIYALASCDETTEWLEFARDCHPPHQAEAEALLVHADELGRKLNKFLTSVRINHRSQK